MNEVALQEHARACGRPYVEKVDDHSVCSHVALRDDRVVHQRHEVPIRRACDEITVREHIPDDGDFRATDARANRARCVRGPIANCPEEDVPFDPCVRVVEVEDVVVRAAKHIVHDVQNRAGALDVERVDGIKRAHRLAEKAAAKHCHAARACAGNHDHFKRRRRWRKDAVRHHKRRIIEFQISPRRSSKRHRVQENLAAENVDGLRCIARNVCVGNASRRRTRAAVHSDTAPRAAARHGHKANRLRRRSLGNHRAARCDRDSAARRRDDHGSRFNRQRVASGNRDAPRQSVWPARGAPRFIASERPESHFLIAVKIPHVLPSPCKLQPLSVERLDEHPVHARRERHRQRTPRRLPRGPARDQPVHRDRASRDGRRESR